MMKTDTDPRSDPDSRARVVKPETRAPWQCYLALTIVLLTLALGSCGCSAAKLETPGGWSLRYAETIQSASLQFAHGTVEVDGMTITVTAIGYDSETQEAIVKDLIQAAITAGAGI
jgi:hypothetical protein